MANDRMQLKCKVCGEIKTIAKNFGDVNWDFRDYGIQDFLNKHEDCDYTDLHKFVLVYEDD